MKWGVKFLKLDVAMSCYILRTLPFTVGEQDSLPCYNQDGRTLVQQLPLASAFMPWAVISFHGTLQKGKVWKTQSLKDHPAKGSVLYKLTPTPQGIPQWFLSPNLTSTLHTFSVNTLFQLLEQWGQSVDSVGVTRGDEKWPSVNPRVQIMCTPSK